MKCKWNNSPSMLLEPTLEQLKENQMGSNPNANLNHHMKSHDQAPCDVTRSTDKLRLHDALWNCIWSVTALAYQHWISSRDLSMKKLGIIGTEMIFTLPRCLLL